MNGEFIPDENQVLDETGIVPSDVPQTDNDATLSTAGGEENVGVGGESSGEEPGAVTPTEEMADLEPVATVPAEEPVAEDSTSPAGEGTSAETTHQETPVVETRADVNLAEKTLAELLSSLQSLLEDPNRIKRVKEVEALKTAFYKKLSRERTDAGYAPVDASAVKLPELASPEPSPEEEPAEHPVAEQVPDNEAAVEESSPEVEPVTPAPEEPAEEPETPVAEIPVEELAAPAKSEEDNPFVVVEKAFKELYAKFKAERAEYNRLQDKDRTENLAKKEAVIEDLKALVTGSDDTKDSFPAFREIQARWREIGPVPVQNFRNINDLYQFYVEQFYDKVKINRDMRDLDFKKNLDVKTKFCEAAEKLAESDNVVEAFRELQKLHEQWKEYGPVSKEFRESIWERFKAATAVINKRYQAHFEGLKKKQNENLEAKTALCERVEAMLANDDINSSSEWNRLSKEMEEIQQEWRTIGFATKKENQRIYDRFRAARDKFYERKRVFYSGFKDSMNENIAKKMAIIEQAEALKTSTEWKKTTDQFINLQKQWKEIGAVPRKKSDLMWKRFRAACDEFFAAKEKNAKPENNFYGNLKAKKALIEEIKAYEPSDDDAQALLDFQSRWQEIGFVPFKEKENINQAYREAINEKFPSSRGSRRREGGSSRSSAPRRPLTEKDRLIQQYTRLQQDIDTYENNIGFFATSKNSAPLIQQMQQRIEASKKELKELEEKIRKIEDDE